MVRHTVSEQMRITNVTYSERRLIDLVLRRSAVFHRAPVQLAHLLQLYRT